MKAPESSSPPAPVRIIGHGISRAVARFPWTWPLFRGFTRRFFDRVAPVWDTRTASPERMAPLDAALEVARVTPRRILDLGTGTGKAAIWLAERFPEASIVGVDLAPKMIEAARGRLPEELTGRVRYEVADAGARLPFADAGFDLVAQVSVSAFFAETARVIEPGGALVVVSRLGPATPAHTPPRLLRRGFEREGLEWVDAGAAGVGTYYVLRKPDPVAAELRPPPDATESETTDGVPPLRSGPHGDIQRVAQSTDVVGPDESTPCEAATTPRRGCWSNLGDGASGDVAQKRLA